MYRNSVIDGLLKHISKKAAMNAKWNYFKEVTFNSLCISGQPNRYTDPTFTQRKKKQLYNFIRGILPENYLEYGREEVNGKLEKLKIPDSR